MEQLLKPFGVSHQQFDILQILNHNYHGFMSLKEIQMSLINQTSNTTRLVEKLKLKGLVETQTNANNRSKLDISITKQGLTLLDKIYKPLGDLKMKLETAFTKKDAVDLSRILPKIVAMLDE